MEELVRFHDVGLGLRENLNDELACFPRCLEQIPPAREHEGGPSTADSLVYGLRADFGTVFDAKRITKINAAIYHWMVEEGATV